MSLRGDLKVGRLKRGDLLLRAKGHFKGGPKRVDETMPKSGKISVPNAVSQTLFPQHGNFLYSKSCLIHCWAHVKWILHHATIVIMGGGVQDSNCD